MNNIFIPHELSTKNLEIYKKLKSETKKGFYNGLKVSKTNNNTYIIITTIDILKNTLLF